MVKANCRGLQLETSFPTAHLFRVPAPDENFDGAAACDAANRFVAEFGP
jgi:hypothetical protein